MMMARSGALSVLFILALVGSSFAAYGVDISTAASQAAFSCMKGQGFTNVVTRCYMSVGRVDPNCVNNVRNARAAGMSVDVYLFPCTSCGNPAGQMQALWNLFGANKLDVDILWLDIEGPGSYWPNNQAANRDFLSALINEGNALGAKMGIYSSASQWNPIFGAWDGGSSLPLWYAHYDGVANFNDFSPFAGWTRPVRKQFNDGPDVCGIGSDHNYIA